MMDYVVSLADERGIPRSRLIAVHADLGRSDWKETLPTVERHAQAYGLRLEVVRRERGDLLSHVRERRMWPGPTTRFCTSQHKTGPSNKAITRFVQEINVRRMVPKTHLLKRLGIRPVRVLNVFGMRALESSSRKQQLIFERQHRESSGVRTIDRWLPIHDWSLEEVWDRIQDSGIDPHPAYAFGQSRSSCSFCILSSRADLIRAARMRPEFAREHAEVEADIGHRFRNDISMAEIIELASKEDA